MHSQESTFDFLQKSASTWPPLCPLANLRVFWQPTNDVALCCLKNVTLAIKVSRVRMETIYHFIQLEMARYKEFLVQEYDKGFFMTPSVWPFTPKSVESLMARALYRLTIPDARGEWADDKSEVRNSIRKKTGTHTYFRVTRMTFFRY